MIKKVKEFEKYVAITGFRNVEIKNIDDFFKTLRGKLERVHVQFFDAKFVATKDHLYFAALNGLKAFASKLNRSKSLAVEALLYASARRQIRNAVNTIGITPASTQVAVLIISELKEQAEAALETVSKLISGQRDDDVLELTDDKFADIKKLFSISDMELEAKVSTKDFLKRALVDLVIEHVALFATER